MSGPTRVWQATLDGTVECWTFWDSERHTRTIVDGGGGRILEIHGNADDEERLTGGFYWTPEAATAGVVAALRKWLSLAETERREAHERQRAIELQAERERRRALLAELER